MCESVFQLHDQTLKTDSLEGGKVYFDSWAQKVWPVVVWSAYMGSADTS